MKYFYPLCLFLLLSVVGTAQQNFCIEVNSKLANSAAYSSLVASSETVLGNTLIVGNNDVTVEQLEQALAQAYPQSTFRLDGQFKSPLDKTVTVYKYVQSILGKEVENGGYTISARGISTGPGPGPGPRPCYSLVSFSPNLFSLQGSTGVITKAQARSFALAHRPQTSTVKSVALSVLHEDVGVCKSLTYKVVAVVDSKLSAIHVNAHDGTLSYFEEVSDNNVVAPTLYYGDQDMQETAIGGNEFRLESNNGVVTHDYIRFTDQSWNYSSDRIPTRQFGGFWPIDGISPDLSSHVYQTHHVVTSSVEPLSDVGIEFENFFVKAFAGENATSRGVYDDRENAYLRFGHVSSSTVTNLSESFASYDVAGHEIGHSFIFRYFLSTESSSGRDGRTLHEGLADIIGTYSESRIQGSNDLVMGDDSPNLSSGRSILEAFRSADLDDPPFPCFLSLPDCVSGAGSCSYDRSGPIVKWFAYLVAGASVLDGEVDADIEALDIQVATSIVTESITKLNSTTATIPDLRDETLATALTHFGQCSKEYTSIARAWNEVCVGFTPVCDFAITGPRSICDDAETPIFYYITDPIPGETYRWYFPFDWSVEGVSGTNTTTGTYIKVTNIPSYTSYPAPYTIKVFPITAGASFTEEIKGQIVSCSGETCGKSLIKSTSNSFTSSIFQKTDERLKDASSVMIYDILGRNRGTHRLVNGQMPNETLQILDAHSVFIFTYMNDEGEIIYSEKKVIVR